MPSGVVDIQHIPSVFLTDNIIDADFRMVSLIDVEVPSDIRVAELQKRGHEVSGCDLQHQRDENFIRADVSNYRQLERVFEANDYDYVYHLAAEFGRINGEEYYDTLWETNVIGTRNILEWQTKKGFKLIFASSEG